MRIRCFLNKMRNHMKASKTQILLILLTLSLPAPGQTNAPTPALSQASEPTLLKSAELAALLPPTVFFEGKTAPVQTRNSAGIRLTDKSLVLVSLVDASGYSSQVQEKYQAYLITESPIEIDGHRLPPGAYGCGFVSNNGFIVMDIGGHDLFTAHTTHDENLHRPTPLQIIAAPNQPGKYQLYAGRNFVIFAIATGN
jgi:hypothetical protein